MQTPSEPAACGAVEENAQKPGHATSMGGRRDHVSLRFPLLLCMLPTLMGTGWFAHDLADPSGPMPMSPQRKLELIQLQNGLHLGCESSHRFNCLSSYVQQFSFFPFHFIFTPIFISLCFGQLSMSDIVSDILVVFQPRRKNEDSTPNHWIISDELNDFCWLPGFLQRILHLKEPMD